MYKNITIALSILIVLFSFQFNARANACDEAKALEKVKFLDVRDEFEFDQNFSSNATRGASILGLANTSQIMRKYNLMMELGRPNKHALRICKFVRDNADSLSDIALFESIVLGKQTAQTADQAVDAVRYTIYTLSELMYLYDNVLEPNGVHLFDPYTGAELDREGLANSVNVKINDIANSSFIREGTGYVYIDMLPTKLVEKFIRDMQMASVKKQGPLAELNLEGLAKYKSKIIDDPRLNKVLSYLEVEFRSSLRAPYLMEDIVQNNRDRNKNLEKLAREAIGEMR